MQQGKLGEGVEIEVHELTPEDPGESYEPSEGGMKDWRSRTWIRGKEYSWLHRAVKKKKTVMHLAAAKLLEELLPGEQGKSTANVSSMVSVCTKCLNKTLGWNRTSVRPCGSSGIVHPDGSLPCPRVYELDFCKTFFG